MSQYTARFATVLFGVGLSLGACAPESGAPGAQDVGESKAALSTAGMHGFMLTSDQDSTLAVTALGAVSGTTLKLYKGCTWENPECTWSYVNGMIVSDADPTLAINAWGGAADGTVLRLSNACTTSNTSCTWTYSHGEFLSDANTALAINAWGGAAQGATLKLASACTASNTSCTWTMHRAMIFSAASSALAWNAWGGAVEGANVRLSDICDRNNTSCTWTVRKGTILSDANSNLGVIGGNTNLTQLQVTGFCAPPNTSICNWTFKHGEILNDTNAVLAVNAYGGAAAGAYLKVNSACTTSNTSCLWSETVGGPQCVGNQEPLCPGAPDAPSSIVHQDPVIATILANARAAHPEVPAIAAAIVIDRQIHLATAGKRKWTDATDTLQETDQFELDSSSKAVAGAVMAIAVDRGIMSWSDTLGSDASYQSAPFIFPSYLNVTLAELNAHASGAWYDTGAHSCGGCAASDNSTFCVNCRAAGYNTNANAASDYANLATPALRRTAITIDAMRDQPLFPRGQGTVYGSGTMYALSLLENKTGADFLSLLKHWIFTPLGMSHSGTLPDVWQHNWNGVSTSTMVSVPPLQEQNNPRLGLGGISASIEDFARFALAAMHSSSAAGHLWSDAAQKTMMQTVEQSDWTPHAFSEDMMDQAGGPEIWKNGCDVNGNNSVISVWPERKIALLVMTNYTDPGCGSAALSQVYGNLITALSSSYGLSAPPFAYTSAPTYLAPAASVSATSTAPGHDAVKAFDGSYGTFWQAADGATSADLQVNLPAATNVGHIVINEAGPFTSTPATSSPIGGGNATQLRSTTYQVWLTIGSSEILVASGTNIGVNRLITIPTYTGVTRARLSITGTNGPAISEFHVYP